MSELAELGTTITVDEAVAYVREIEQKYDCASPKGEIVETSQPSPEVVFVYTTMTGPQPWGVWREPDGKGGSYIYGEW